MEAPAFHLQEAATLHKFAEAAYTVRLNNTDLQNSLLDGRLLLTCVWGNFAGTTARCWEESCFISMHMDM